VKIGVIVGRFQVPELHAGHMHLIQEALNENDALLVLLGISRSLNSENILDVGLRRAVVANALTKTHAPGKVYWVGEILDESSDLDWSRKLDEHLYQSYRGHTFTLYGGENGFTTRYKGRNPTKIVKNLAGDFSGTKIRANIYTENRKKEGFAAGVIHGAQLFNAPKMAVDFAVFHGFSGKVLMGKKYGETLWRLPGGMVDFNESLETAAKRELWEECSIADIEPTYVGSFVVGDSRWPENERPLTALFYGKHSWATPTAGDDLVIVNWVDHFDHRISPTHQPLVAAAYAKYSSSNR
jgi:8-oxo-dGTP pyrophosphatase MutT (NUDIX family)